MRFYSTNRTFCFFAALSLMLIACTKKDIQFGNALGESYSNLIQVDTLSVRFSTYVSDSFATNGMTYFIVGGYADSLLGTTRAKAYVQVMAGLGQILEDNSVYDSLCFVLKLNGYSYGDTTQLQTVWVHELTESLAYPNGSFIYNTSSFGEAATPLGSKTQIISPHLTDSIIVRLDDAKGREFFSKFQNADADIQTADAFLTYFKGLSINMTSTKPSAVYGFEKTDSTLYLRMYYHTTIPYPEAKWKDFSYYSNLSSNQIITDRSGTALAGIKSTDISSTQTGNRSFTQAGTGTMLKMTFPTLRSLLQLDPTVKLLKASLVLKVPPQSYTGATPLPPSLMLYQTDEGNAYNSALYTSDGVSYLTASPSVDPIYDGLTTYTFDVTSYINKNLATSGTENQGLFLTEYMPGSSGKINRGVFYQPSLSTASSQLLLSLLTVKN